MAIGSLNSTNCPSDGDLLAFFRSDLPRSDMDVIHRHVEQCENCLLFVDRVGEQSDTIIQALSAMSPTIDDEPAFHALRNQLITSPESVDGTVSIDDLTDEYKPRVSPANRLGEQVGDYELTDVLGSGANGSVYRARHAKLDRDFAVKLLAPTGANVDRSLERFQNELRAVGRLDHPNIVRATNAGEFNGEHFLVMEFVDGIDVSTLVRRLPPLAVCDAVEIVCQAAGGLAAAHGQRMVHRDVKPSNLLFGFDGVVRVLDLGLVSMEDDHEAPFTALARGTADYMAPEQWDNYDAVDARADIYSLGCTLFKLLLGHAPFVPLPSDCKSKMEAHQFAQVPSLRVRRADVPLGLDRAIRTMLQKNPAKRFEDMEAAIAAMTPYAEGSNLRRVADQLRGRPSGLPTSEEKPSGNIFTRRNALVGVAAGMAGALIGQRMFPSIPAQTLLQFDVWRPMESTKPSRILAAKPAKKTPILIEPVSPEYTIATEECAVYPMGRPVHERFQMETAITLTDASAAGGLFYRYHREEFTSDAVVGHLHSFYSFTVSRDENKELVVDWAAFEWTHAAAESIVKRTPLAKWKPLPSAADKELLMSVELGTAPMPVVSVANKAIEQNMWRLTYEGEHAVRVARNELNRQFDGQIGLFVDRSVVRFKQPRIRYIK